jgi:hypothetical protein
MTPSVVFIVCLLFALAQHTNAQNQQKIALCAFSRGANPLPINWVDCTLAPNSSAWTDYDIWQQSWYGIYWDTTNPSSPVVTSMYARWMNFFFSLFLWFPSFFLLWNSFSLSLLLFYSLFS